MKTCTIKAWEAIKDVIDVKKIKHVKEVKYSELPKEAIAIGYELAPYGDWTYYVLPDGSFVATYYDIGD